jgi:K(+)-stimulated pyrophosphate-energized sodium pump
MENLIYILPVFGLVALAYMSGLSSWVTKQDAGDAKMTGIAKNIADGAMAFLKAEYRILAVYVVLAGIALAALSQTVEHSSILIVASFVVGCIFSALSGFLGMRIATKANVRTTQAAKTSLAKALKVSFRGGTVMGLGVAGLAVLGISTLFIVFFFQFMGGEWASQTINGKEVSAVDLMTKVLEVLAGFSLGAESIALWYLHQSG